MTAGGPITQHRVRWWLSVAVAVSVVVGTAGCGGVSAGAGEAAASKAREQAIPATTVLYERFAAASARLRADGARPPDIESGSYVPCDRSGTKLHYSVSLRLYAPARKSPGLNAYGRQVAYIVARSGWTVRRESVPTLPPGSPLPYPASLAPSTIFYAMTRYVRSTDAIGALFVYPQPGYGAGGSITINSACFDAGPAYKKLSADFDSSPLPIATK